MIRMKSAMQEEDDVLRVGLLDQKYNQAISPTVTIEKVEGGYKITIKDKNGTTEETIPEMSEEKVTEIVNTLIGKHNDDTTAHKVVTDNLTKEIARVSGELPQYASTKEIEDILNAED